MASESPLFITPKIVPGEERPPKVRRGRSRAALALAGHSRCPGLRRAKEDGGQGRRWNYRDGGRCLTTPHKPQGRGQVHDSTLAPTGCLRAVAKRQPCPAGSGGG
jgi:hypothetical protein